MDSLFSFCITQQSAFSTQPSTGIRAYGLNAELNATALLLPAARLQHVRFIEGADGESFHGSRQILADFK
jgi:hypothetical protein